MHMQWTNTTILLQQKLFHLFRVMGRLMLMVSSLPYASGQQTITAEWVGASSTLAEILNVTVLPGTPTEVVLNGCERL